MQLKEIGEFGFINRFADKFNHLINEDELGIGDDCAILQLNDEKSYVTTTDLLVEDIHFLKDRISARDLGYKSLAVNLSDVASMGAQARFSFLSLGIPSDIDVGFLDDFMEGYYELSEKYGVPLMGGDTTKSPDKLLINVVAIGQCKTTDIRLRSMAKVGDVICVTGPLGDSAGGLKALLEHVNPDNDISCLINTHHCPEPRLKEGEWLAKQSAIHAMMDISDGVSSDLKHILESSGVAGQIDLSLVPFTTTLEKVALTYGWDITQLALSGGEDYELLFTMAADQFEQINDAFKKKFAKPLHLIGNVTEGKPTVSYVDYDKEVVLNKNGFNHFE